MNLPKAALIRMKTHALLTWAVLCIAAVGTQASSDSELFRHTVEAYPCDPLTHKVRNHVFEGDALTICVEVEQTAINKGIVIEAIDSFAWIREDEYEASVPVDDSEASNEGFASYDCIPGSTICAFESNLVAQNYLRVGKIIGAGTIRFASGDRSLQHDRDLQGSSSGFNLTVKVEKAEESNRPPLRTAGGMGPAIARVILSDLAILGAWMIIGG